MRQSVGILRPAQPCAHGGPGEVSQSFWETPVCLSLSCQLTNHLPFLKVKYLKNIYNVCNNPSCHEDEMRRRIDIP